MIGIWFFHHRLLHTVIDVGIDMYKELVLTELGTSSRHRIIEIDIFVKNPFTVIFRWYYNKNHPNMLQVAPWQQYLECPLIRNPPHCRCRYHLQWLLCYLIGLLVEQRIGKVIFYSFERLCFNEHYPNHLFVIHIVEALVKSGWDDPVGMNPWPSKQQIIWHVSIN